MQNNRRKVYHSHPGHSVTLINVPDTICSNNIPILAANLNSSFSDHALISKSWQLHHYSTLDVACYIYYIMIFLLNISLLKIIIREVIHQYWKWNRRGCTCKTFWRQGQSYLCACHEGIWGNKGIDLLIHNYSTGWGEWLALCPGHLSPWTKTLLPTEEGTNKPQRRSAHSG